MMSRAGSRVLATVYFISSPLLLLTGCSCEPDDGVKPMSTAQVGFRSEGFVPRPPSFTGQFEVRESPFDSSVRYFSAIGEPEQEALLRAADEPFEVLEFGPSGELPVEVRRPTIFAVFDQPMVPLAQLGKPIFESDVMTIEPELPGSYRWMGSRILSFQPDEPMTSQLEYRVTIAGAKTPAEENGEHFEFSFFREPLDLVDVRPGPPEPDTYIDRNDVPPREAREITVQFSYPVDMEFIAGFLEVRVAEGGTPATFSPRRCSDISDDQNRYERTVVLKLDSLLPENVPVEVRLLEGARSKPEYRGREEPSARSFHTLRPFKYISHHTHSSQRPGSPSDDANPVFLRFSHPPAEQDWNEVINVSLPVDDLNEHVDLYHTVIRLNNLPVEYETTFEIELQSNLRDIHGRHLIPSRRDEKVVAETVEVEVPAASTYFHTRNRGSRMLEAGFPPRIVFELQNPNPGLWHVDAIDDPFSGFSPNVLKPYDLEHIEPNTRHFEVVELAHHLNEDGFGFVGVSWNFAPRRKDGSVDTRRQTDLQLQVTDLGVTTRYAYDRLLIWVRSLKTAKPIAGAEVIVSNYERRDAKSWKARTGDDGLAIIELEPGDYARELVNARGIDRLEMEVVHGSDRARFRPRRNHNAFRAGIRHQRSPSTIEDEKPVPYMFTDRGIYRPGEEVAFKVLDRTWTTGEYEPYQGRYTVSAREDRRQSETIWTDTGTLSALGGSHGAFSLPEDLDPGDYIIEYRRSEGTSKHRLPFQVAHFRPAAFEVLVNTPPETLFHGDRISFSVLARYLAGGGVAGGSLSYRITKHPVDFQPSGTRWNRYTFGPRGRGRRALVDSGSGVLDGAGRGTQALETGNVGVEGKTYSYRLEARVQDPARQELAGRGSVLVHPARFHLGAVLSAGKQGWATFVKAGDEATAEIVAVGPDGDAYRQDVEVKAEWVERRWHSVRQAGRDGRLHTRYETEEEVVSTETIEIRNGSVKTSFTPEEAGQYLLRVSSHDLEERKAITELRFYVTGPQWIPWVSSQPEEIQIVPDKETYEVGDTARLLVKTPLPDGSYLLTLEREGIFEHSVVEIEGSTGTIEVPLEDCHVPVVYAALSSASNRSEPPESYFEPDLGKPKGFFGIVPLAVDPSPRELTIEILADRESYRPGSKAEIRVRVTHDEEPVEGAEVTLLAADRGILDLIDYRVPDPVEHFFNSSRFPLAVRGDDSRHLLIDPVTYEIVDLQGGGGKLEEPSDPISGDLDERKDFNPLAVFEPQLLTDPNGEVVARFNWPDSLTTYRVTALAAEETRFGKNEHEISVQNPLTVRTALPQRLRVRDTASAGVVITNLTDEQQQIELRLEMEGEESSQDGHHPRTVEVQANETTEIRFPLHFEQSGTVDLAFVIRSRVLSERLHARLTVEEACTREAFTLAGTLDATKPVREGVVLPASILPESGKLDLRFTALQIDHLREPLRRWLTISDTRSLEMLIYRAAPYAVFGQGLEYVLSPDEAATARRHTEWLLDRLGKYQHKDGGFVFQPRHTKSPYGSTPRMTVLGAQAARWFKDREGSDNPVDHGALAQRLNELTRDERTPPFERALGLLMLIQLAPAGGHDSVLTEIMDLEDALGVSGYAVVSVAAAALNRNSTATEAFDRLTNMLQIGTRSVDFVETYESRSYFDSTVLRLATAHLAYQVNEPDSVVPPRLLSSINRAILKSPWVGSMDILWAAKTLARELRLVESHDDMSIRVSLEEEELISREMQAIHESPTGDEFSLDAAPIERLSRGQLHPLHFETDSAQPLFYSATLSYELPNEVIIARDEGFSLFRRIEDLDGNEVSAEELERGETYRVSVTIGTDRNRFGSFLSVPVASGMEILDGSLSTTSSYDEVGGVTSREWTRETQYGDTETYTGEGLVRWTYRSWRAYFMEPDQRIYPAEVTYYFSHLYPGSQTVSFLARATTPGVYPVPPATVELEGQEEVFGRTDGELAIIK